MLFPKPDHGIRTKQNKNDAKIQPVPDNSRQNYCSFNHPRDGAPEIGEELQEGIRFRFRDLVRAILCQPLLRFGLTEARPATNPTSSGVPSW